MSETNVTPTVPARVAVLSAAGIWACYYILVSARGLIADRHHYLEMLGPRAVVALAGFAITLVIWLALRRIEARLLGAKIAAILVLALPASLAIAWVNDQAFKNLDKSYSILDDAPALPSFPPPVPDAPPSGVRVPGGPPPKVRIQKDKDGNYILEVPGIETLVVPDPRAHDRASYWKNISEVAIGRYFLLLAWGALFLALANAERVRAYERREGELRRAAKAAELRSLRYQVNPHFLFNTLNSLSSLVLSGRTADAEAMIQTLSTFYRTSLTGDPTLDVPLAEEVRLQRLYLEVEAVRFPERLRTVFDVPAELEDACVPGLILQPLVENAVKHAVAATNRPVTITISARTVGNILRLSVSDDGPGHSTNRNGCGIGLSNVRDRLAARYGTAEGLKVDTTPPGYRVVLMLPLTREGC